MTILNDIMNKIHPKKAIFSFRGFSSTESYCQVDIYYCSKPIVIISELKANQGTSAINLIEKVAAGISKKYELDPEKTTFISHCPEGQGMYFGAEDFHIVPIKWNGEVFEMTTSGRWELTNRDKVEKLIGQPFVS